jgi:hypothetical protein
MNKPEPLPNPDFSHWLPASLRDHADDQKAISRIAKKAARPTSPMGIKR